MAFCTSCGATLDSKAQFCVKCGARQALSSPSVPAAAPAAKPAGGSSALKIVLIVIVAVVLLGLVGSVATMIFIGKRLHNARVSVKEHGGEATIETPMGTIHTQRDPEMIKRDLGVDVYPGAKTIEGGSEAQTMGMHTVTGVFETGDSVEKVGEFYRQRYPKGIYTQTDREVSLVSSGKGAMVTITAQDEGGKTKITVVNMSGRGIGSRSFGDSGQPN